MVDERFDVAVIGAGAAGLLAACRSAELGRRVVLLEKNTKAGVKILMSGGTRCNLTHACDRRGIIDAFGTQGRFLHSPLAALPPDDLIRLVEAEGVATKVEPTGKVFPASDRAADVLTALLRRLKRSGAALALAEPVLDIERASGGFMIATAKRAIRSQRLVITTGGRSYPGCGTTGDGYGWLERLGHTIVKTTPALTPLKTRADWAKSLKGVTITDVAAHVVDDRDICLDRRRGSLLFAHFGLSGPVILDISRVVATHARPRSLTLVCDFLPAESAADLTNRLQGLSQSDGKKRLIAVFGDDLPKRLGEALIRQAQLPADRRLAELSRGDRATLVRAIKEGRIPITGTLGFEKAEVTAGGVSLDEVDSRTMASKIVPDLHVAGEVLDLDGPIGGYNFQAAFSTGWLAGTSAGRMKKSDGKKIEDK